MSEKTLLPGVLPQVEACLERVGAGKDGLPVILGSDKNPAFLMEFAGIEGLLRFAKLKAASR